MGPSRHALHDQDEENSDSVPENTPDSPSSGDEARTAPSAPSPKKRKGLQKRVISVPITGGGGDHQGEGGSNKMKGEGSSFPPSDSWAWRKYGQKPIKGSPYPRGYYRCSSSKGCPARKQVERSRSDPTMLLVTYSSDHNHPVPAARNHHHQQQQQPPVSTKSEPEEETASANGFIVTEIVEDALIDDPGFHWLAEAAASSSAISYPRRPIYAGSDYSAAAFTMGEEEESLFGDLGELPECSLVFRLAKKAKPEETDRRCGLGTVPCIGNAV
ncbi:hypothetical protein MLD38_033299 [Melastoma candidum]|uniref:Uncharacterized protein n=1 Tax=Melastoma candidum TaxID=119954 RepID=A0ACB9M6F3_9MYRT|nr:hypothetical protein MLD38_033299 [Melastoma candidum]